MRKNALALFAAVATVAACGGDFDPTSRITGLRVLAVRAQKGPTGARVDGTYAKPGDTISLEALWLDAKGRSTQWAWTVCVRPASGTVLGCFQKLAQDAQKSGAPPPFALGKDKDRYEFTIPSDALEGVPAAARAGAIVGVVTAVCPGTLSIATQVNKNDLPFSCKDDAGNVVPNDDFILGFKRIFLRTKDENKNPVLTGVTLDGKVWGPDDVLEVPANCGAEENRFDRCAGGGVSIVPTLDPSSFETGTDEFGAAYNEQLVVQYYGSEGLFETDVRRAQDPLTKFALRSGKGGSEVRVFIVARDNRGGVSWLERKVKPAAK